MFKGGDIHFCYEKKGRQESGVDEETLLVLLFFFLCDRRYEI